MKDIRMFENIQAALFGVAVGDALGVPVEFQSRESLRNKPVTDMVGYGTYNLPAGTWSDDSSLTFCLAEALCADFDTARIGHYFVEWYENAFWSARGKVFDVGMTTSEAIEKIAEGVKPELAGGFRERDNGNGSLMRILPLLFTIADALPAERFELIRKVSSITHGHIRSVIACFYYLEFARQILHNKDKFAIYRNLQKEIPAHFQTLSIAKEENAHFDRLLKDEITLKDEDAIQSTGYVMHTLETAIWCLLTTDNYQDAVLKAVNLGDDTDTSAAVTGGLAALLYGLESIPPHWRKALARHDDIADLAKRLYCFNYER